MHDDKRNRPKRHMRKRRGGSGTCEIAIERQAGLGYSAVRQREASATTEQTRARKMMSTIPVTAASRTAPLSPTEPRRHSAAILAGRLDSRTPGSSATATRPGRTADSLIAEEHRSRLGGPGGPGALPDAEYRRRAGGW